MLLSRTGKGISQQFLSTHEKDPIEVAEKLKSMNELKDATHDLLEIDFDKIN